MNPLYVGVDIASKENWACCMNGAGDELASFAFANNLVGAADLKDRCLRLATRHGIDSLLVGMEATANFWWHLSVYLSTERELSHLNPKVYNINPKIVKGFKKSYPFLPKTDRIDAWVIADRLRFGRLPAQCYQDERYQQLQRLTRFRYRLIQQTVEEKNYFLSYLALKFNTFKPSGIFSDVFGPTSVAVLSEFYSVDEIAEADIDELAALVEKHSNNRIADPLKVAKSVRTAARDAYRLDTRILKPVNFILAASLKNIQALKSQIKTTDIAIAKELAHIPHTLQTVNGLGPVLCAGIISEVGDVTRFKNQAALAKYAGLTWRGTKAAILSPRRRIFLKLVIHTFATISTRRQIRFVATTMNTGSTMRESTVRQRRINIAERQFLPHENSCALFTHCCNLKSSTSQR